MEDDDYLAMEEVSDSRTKASKSSNASKRKPSGKTKSAPKEKEIVIRDQRKIGLLDSPGTSSSPAPASVAQKKLPNFKKREGAGPSTPKPKPPVAPKEAQALKTPSTIPVATNASSRTVTKGQDMNLNDPNEYKNLFKTAGNTASKNRNEEGKAIARRKEIEKLRQEAKARQTAEMNKNKFDLQEQLEAISAYEEEMAEETNGNFLLYPNFLGVRWRMDWEQKLKEPGEV
ncbi:hypothetical protein DL96DRAFT_1754656 [Flagelloscypha sp. PMI_526]|nr:hypothetical protein DL96DRAFT_1754656 [Flagelloscypha sp. PMI_526]